MSEKQIKVHSAVLPLYSEVRELLRIFEGVPKAIVTRMLDAIGEHTGTPQNTVDWTEPHVWIGERLGGDEAHLATRVWTESNRKVNPRRIYGSYLFINRYKLLNPTAQGIYRLTDRGGAFQQQDPVIVRHIDEHEGIPQLLSILATKTRSRRGDLLPEWREFLQQYSNFGTESTAKTTLRRRLLNLIERQFVAREGQSSYVITAAGIEYAARGGSRGGTNQATHPKMGTTQSAPKHAVLQAIKTFNDGQRKALKERLETMHPYRFEHLIGELLEAMGYEDVQVTKASGDKGVDVIATVQFGITTITEYVQVKRHQGSIGRQTLDQLRGALPYHKAIRGTIITTGTFSQGCKEGALYVGAAPIGLIDGERLLDLLFEYKLGVKGRPATLYELDEEFFSRSGEAEPTDVLQEVADSSAE